MARPYRLKGENCFYHVTSRGNDRKKIFLRKDDYERFLGYVLVAKERFKFKVYAYCLMNNHYHLLFETTLPNISEVMQYINGSYTIYYNTKYRRCGHLFQGRFKSIVVEKDLYFLALSHYIHLNPVRAGLVSSPERYPWSSYWGYLGQRNKYIDNAAIEKHLGMSKRNYRQFVLEGIGQEVNPLKDVYAGFLLGSVRFIKDQLKLLKNQVSSEEVAYKAALRTDSLDQDEILTAVSKRYHRSVKEIYDSNRRPMRVKQVAIYLLRKYLSLIHISEPTRPY